MQRTYSYLATTIWGSKINPDYTLRAQYRKLGDPKDTLN